VNFSTSHTFPETRVMGLSDGVHFTILLSLCYAQYWRVTDGRTRRCRKASRGYYISEGSVLTHLRYDGIFGATFIANFLEIVTVK